jgi:hypothetical protein
MAAPSTNFFQKVAKIDQKLNCSICLQKLIFGLYSFHDLQNVKIAEKWSIFANFCQFLLHFMNLNHILKKVGRALLGEQVPQHDV